MIKLLFLIILLHILAIYKLVFLPTPELFIYPYLTNHGLKPYSQILDQHFPGLMFLPVNFDNLGMQNETIARIWLVGIVVATHILIFFICRKVLSSSKKALMVNFLYLLWQPFFEGWVLWLDTFLPLFLLPSFYCIYKYVYTKGKVTNVFFAGLFLGLGVIFKQVLIPLSFLILIFLFLYNRRLKTALIFLYGFLPPIILMLLYFWESGVLSDFWYWTVTFNLTTFAQLGRKAAPFSQFIRVWFVAAFALLPLFFKDKKLSLLLLIFIIFPIVEIYNRFDFVHFQPALPFVIMATILGFTQNNKHKIKIFLVLVYGLVALRWLTVFYSGHISNHIFFFDQHTKEIALKVKQYSSPREKIFIFGEIPHIYQMSQTLPAGDIFVFQFPWFLKIAEDRILEGVKKDKPNIIVSDRTVEIEGQNITDFAKNIDQYIQKNYQIIDRVDKTEILRRNSI